MFVLVNNCSCSWKATYEKATVAIDGNGKGSIYQLNL